ncbi:MAG: AAA family ATPase [Chloroflexota bacterium]
MTAAINGARPQPPPLPGTPAAVNLKVQDKIDKLRADEQAKAILAAEKADAENESHVGWSHVDLDRVLAGDRRRVLPTIGKRSDGMALLYPGKEHIIAGEPEAGKTWWVALIVVEVLKAGGTVVYVDFEDDEDTIVGERLIPLGAPVERLRHSANQFRYHRPDRTLRDRDEFMGAVLGSFPPSRERGMYGADLVVFDGMTEGMGLLGLEISNNDDIPIWRQRVIRPALAAGCATLTTDHVIKDRESRGRYSIGGQHKLAGLTGAMFVIEQGDPFGEGLKGRSRVHITKDRNGKLRRAGQPEGRPGFTYLGDLVGDSTGDRPSFAFYPPTSEEEMAAAGDRKLRGDAQVVLAAIRRIEGVEGQSPGKLKVFNAVKGAPGRKGIGRDRLDVAITYLVEQGCVELVQHGKAVEHRYIGELEQVGVPEIFNPSQLTVSAV